LEPKPLLSLTPTATSDLSRFTLTHRARRKTACCRWLRTWSSRRAGSAGRRHAPCRTPCRLRWRTWRSPPAGSACHTTSPKLREILRARWVILRACWVMLRARWVAYQLSAAVSQFIIRWTWPRKLKKSRGQCTLNHVRFGRASSRASGSRFTWNQYGPSKATEAEAAASRWGRPLPTSLSLSLSLSLSRTHLPPPCAMHNSVPPRAAVPQPVKFTRDSSQVSIRSVHFQYGSVSIIGSLKIQLDEIPSKWHFLPPPCAMQCTLPLPAAPLGQPSC
jgi:hypothetical protein